MKNFNHFTYQLKELYLKERKKEGGSLLPFSKILSKLKLLARQIQEGYELELALNALGLFPLIIFKLIPTAFELFWNTNGFAISDWSTGRKYLHFHPQIHDDTFFDSLRIQLELETNELLTSWNPSLIGNLNSGLGILRVTMKHPPFGKSIVIRKLPSKPLNLETLIDQGQISSQYAHELILSMRQRKNIVIAGEPGSGKTTLLNALLLQLPQTWRVVILEDTKEIKMDSPLVDRLSTPQIRINSKAINEQKSNIIAFSLRNSPDYFIFGEIQSPIDSKIVFEGIASGLRGIVTTHSTNLKTLLIRWKYSHKLSLDLISQIDVIVFTSRDIDETGRVILNVASIHHKKEIIELFSSLGSELL